MTYINKLVLKNKRSDYLLLVKIIITEKQLGNLRLRRNIQTELPKYITSTVEWLNPKAFGNFDEFLERVIFSASRDYTSAFMENLENTEDYYSTWESMKPIVRDIVINQYFDEIHHYYHTH